MNERYDFHPLVAEWLGTHDYSCQHDFRMPENGIVDFLAQHSDGHILVVECKVGPATQYKKSLRQVLNYQRQIPGSLAGYAIPADLVTETLSGRCKARGILLIPIDIPEQVKQSVREYELLRAQTPKPISPDHQNLPKAKRTHLFLGRVALLAHRDFMRRYQEKMETLGYKNASESQYHVLSRIDLDGTHLVTLAERSNMTKQSMGDFIQELETQGYVSRVRDPEDKRASIVTMTERGEKFFKDAQYTIEDIDRAYTDILGEEGLRQLRSTMLKILEHTTDESLT